METPQPSRSQRRDGLATRSVILEAAGHVFAERGFSDATSKEICERANANNAAVNYYFGGKDALYAEVLREAHRQMVSLEDLNEIIDSTATPEEKLRSFLEMLLRTAADPERRWGIKVFLRELASPSPHVIDALTTIIMPKAERLRELILSLTDLPPNSPQAQRALVFTALPSISLIMFPDALRTRILPATAANNAGMLDDMMRYILAGLRALKQ